jgi:MoaA/NifB/PqqE/SkfB family radical SAM enzyme
MEKAGPRYISFHITNRCDARCSHCDIWKQKSPESPDAEHFLRTIDDISNWAEKPEIIIAGGEPLLSPLSMMLIERATLRGMDTLLATNGFQVDAKKAKELAGAGLKIANISLDGFNHTHDRIRNCPGAFDRVMKAVGALHEHGIIVRICTVIMDDNLDQIPGFIDFLMKDGRIDGVFFQAMAQPFGHAQIKEGWWLTHPHFPRDTQRVNTLLDEVLAIKRGKGFILNEDCQFPAIKAYFANPKRFTQALCTVGDMGFTINAAGDVLLCSFMPPVGNIAENRIREIFESEKAKDLRERMHDCDDNCHLLINCSFDPSQLLGEVCR